MFPFVFTNPVLFCAVLTPYKILRDKESIEGSVVYFSYFFGFTRLAAVILTLPSVL